MKSNLILGSLFLLICALDASIILNKPRKNLMTPPESKKLQINIGGKDAHTISITEDGQTLVKKHTELTSQPEFDSSEYNVDEPIDGGSYPENFDDGQGDFGPQFDEDGGDGDYYPPQGEQGYDNQPETWVDDSRTPEGHVHEHDEPQGEDLDEPNKELQDDLKKEIENIKKEIDEIEKALPSNFKELDGEEKVTIEVKQKFMNQLLKDMYKLLEIIQQESKEADAELVNKDTEGPIDMNDQLDNDDHKEGLSDTTSEVAEAQKEDQEAHYDGHATDDEDQEEIDHGAPDMADHHQHNGSYDDYDELDEEEEEGPEPAYGYGGDEEDVDEQDMYHDHYYDEDGNSIGDEDHEDAYSDGTLDEDQWQEVGDDEDYNEDELHENEEDAYHGDDDDDEDHGEEDEDEENDDHDDEYEYDEDAEDEDDEEEDWKHKKNHHKHHHQNKHHHHHAKFRRKFVKAHMVPDHMFRGHLIKAHMVKAHYGLFRRKNNVMHHHHVRPGYFRRKLALKKEAKPQLTQKGIANENKNERKLIEEAIHQGDSRIGPVATDKRNGVVTTLDANAKSAKVNMSEKVDFHKNNRTLRAVHNLSERTDLEKEAALSLKVNGIDKEAIDRSYKNDPETFTRPAKRAIDRSYKNDPATFTRPVKAAIDRSYKNDPETFTRPDKAAVINLSEKTEPERERNLAVTNLSEQNDLIRGTHPLHANTNMSEKTDLEKGAVINQRGNGINKEAWSPYSG